MKRTWFRRGSIAALFLLCASAGCSRDMQYAWSAITGQLNLMSRAIPIEQALNSDTLSEQRRYQLEYILDVRRYAIEELGLTAGRNYTTYVDIGDEAVAYNLSAAAKDSLTPYTWNFPFVGTIPYLGFFSFDAAREYQQHLVDLGYDTVLYPIESYSTLGLFPDPITSAMCDRGESELADLIIHDLTHGTIYATGDSNYSENVATFVGHLGSQRYLADRYGENSDLVQRAKADLHATELHNEFLAQLRRRLEEYYASDLSKEVKIAGRETLFTEAKERFRNEVQPKMRHPELYDWIYDLKFNNAWILLNARYIRSLADFQAVYDHTGGDWAESLRIFSDAAAGSDPIAYLRSVVAGH